MAVTGCLLMAACGPLPEPTRGGQGPSGAGPYSVAEIPELPTPTEASVKVTYTDRAIVFDRATWKRELKAISNDQVNYTFDASSSLAQRLKPDSILFLYGRAFRKVSAVVASGGRLVVTTETAALTDLIQDGTIKWRQQVDFGRGGFVSGNTGLLNGGSGQVHTPDAPSSPTPQESPTDAPPADTPSPDSSPVATAAGDPGMTLIGADGARRTVGYHLADGPALTTADGYKLAVNYQSVPGRVNVALTASKDFGAGSVMVEAKGFVKSYSQQSSLEIHNGTMDSFSQHTDGVQAEMNLSWLAKKDTPGAMAGTSILKPQMSYNLPFAVGGIPMFFELATNLATIPAFSSRGAAKASFRVTYNGDAGIDFSHGATTTSEHHTGDFGVQDSNLTSPAVTSITGLLSFPKLTVGVGWREPGLTFSDSTKGVSAAGWVDLLMTASALTTGLTNAGTGTSCIKTVFAVAYRSGLEFKILGIDLPTAGPKEMWKKHVTSIVPEGSPLCVKTPAPGEEPAAS